MIWIQDLDYVIQDERRVQAHVDLLLEGDRIVQIGKVDPGRAKNAMVLSGKGHIALPGFVNTHTHLYQNMLKGMGDSLGLKPWCEQVTFPFANIIHQEERETEYPRLGYYWSALGAMEMVRSGITSFVDMDIVQDGVLKAWEDIGVRGNLALQLVNRWVPKELMVSDEVRKQRAMDIIDCWHGRGKVSISMAPSTPFACTPDFLEWIKRTAEDKGLQTYIHIAETQWEVEQSLADTGKTPFAYLDDLGFLERPVHAVHSVWTSEADRVIMENRHLDVVYNPKSNAKLGSGIAPIVDYLVRHIPVAVATDGPASNDLLDMFEEMRFGLLLQKASQEDPMAVSVTQMFQMATSAGARMMGLEAGILEEGKLADVVLIASQGVHMQPMNDILQTVFYCAKAADVQTVIIGGEVVLLDGKFQKVDEQEIIEQAVSLRAQAKCSVVTKLDADF